MRQQEESPSTSRSAPSRQLRPLLTYRKPPEGAEAQGPEGNEGTSHSWLGSLHRNGALRCSDFSWNWAPYLHSAIPMQSVLFSLILDSLGAQWNKRSVALKATSSLTSSPPLPCLPFHQAYSASGPWHLLLVLPGRPLPQTPSSDTTKRGLPHLPSPRLSPPTFTPFLSPILSSLEFL